MFRRPLLRRLGAWLERSLDLALPGGDDPPGAAATGTVGAAAPAHACVSATPSADSTATPPVSGDPAHERGLRLAAAHRWNLAQRELERASRAAVHGPATADLRTVREARRQLRVLQKWPRDIPAHLALGHCYFELGLGADAEATFLRALALALDEPAGHYFLALEYAFRGGWPLAEASYARTRALAPGLPPLADWLHELAARGVAG